MDRIQVLLANSLKASAIEPFPCLVAIGYRLDNNKRQKFTDRLRTRCGIGIRGTTEAKVSYISTRALFVALTCVFESTTRVSYCKSIQMYLSGKEVQLTRDRASSQHFDKQSSKTCYGLKLISRGV